MEMWKSLEEYNREPGWLEAAEKEFISSPWFEEDIASFDKEEGGGTGGWARREFLKLMGASIALGSTACVRRPVQKIVPYVKASSDIVPGIANFYSSSWSDRGMVYGLLVKTREGRPIKLEGHPMHPVNRGALSARAQAQLLSLYDPARFDGPRKFTPDDKDPFRRTSHPNWHDVDQSILEILNQGSVGLLTASMASPSTRNLVEEFSNSFGVKHYVWDVDNYGAIREGQELCYGSPKLPQYRLAKAKMIVSIDTDFLGSFQNPVGYAKDYSEGRRDFKHMNKLVVFESLLSLTGMNSDARIRIKPSQQLEVILGLAYEIIVKHKQSTYSGDAQVEKLLVGYAQAASNLGIDSALFEKIAQDLWSHKGESLILAGGINTQSEIALSVQIAANFLNSVLGNDGTTVDHARDWTGFQGSDKALEKLVVDIQAGTVKTLLIHGLNPAYNAPTNLNFVKALSQVKLIYFGQKMDETAKSAKFILPDHHHLENWGDNQADASYLSIQQPTVQPLYNTRAFQDSLLTWISLKTKTDKITWHDYLKNRWKKYSSTSFEEFWTSVLQNGGIDLRSSAVGLNGLQSASPRSFKVQSLASIERLVASKPIEAIIYQKVGMGDGLDANIGWLQELPDPVSKVTWDNYAMMSPQLAKTLAVSEGDLVKVKFGGKVLQLPALVQPGVHDQSIGIAMGYGHDVMDEKTDVAGGVGVNTSSFVEIKDGYAIYSAIAVDVEKASGHSRLANTQSHWNMEGRQIAVQATLQTYLSSPDHIIHRHKMLTLWPEKEYKGHKWGMAVDLNTCTGCAACVVACQAENNISVVGKKYIIQGREMHWIRIDRYYVGTPENPETVIQPMLCQHCDNAPCETVCPVAATTHSPEGINEMTYNRCVGTRYCSNNCPYKVRRFNWFNYSKIREPLNMALNPDVTVRTRGVMEKCTFCTHRITAVKMSKKLKDEKMKDGDVVTACEQSCPTGAIVFGDMNDSESRVSKLFKEQRTYQVLEEVNTAPSVRYMAKIRNNNSVGAHGNTEGGHS